MIKRIARIGFIVFLGFYSFSISGCTSDPDPTPPPDQNQIDSAVTGMEEPQNTETDYSNNEQVVPADTPSIETMVSYIFDAEHGDNGIGTLPNRDANVIEFLFGAGTNQEQWGWQTGNGEVLPASDGNTEADQYFKFDLQGYPQIPEGILVKIEIVYLDRGSDKFTLEYDAGGVGTLSTADEVQKGDSGALQTASFILEDAFFGNNIQEDSDFRINDLADGAEFIQSVTVTLLGEQAEAQTTSDEFSPPAENTVEGWAVLAEKDDHSDVDMSNMLVDFVDIERLRTALEASGWDPEHIHEAREYDRETLVAELDWLEEVADENDVVFFYVTGHGGYLSRVLLWEEFFPAEWEEIASQRRVLLIDNCLAARYTNPINNDPNPHLSIATADQDELNWKALEGEGLPFIGAPFTKYFAEALIDPESDTDGDGYVSVQEAALIAEEAQRTFMHEILFSFPEYVQSFRDFGLTPDQDPTFPDTIFDDTIGEPVYFVLKAYP